MGTEAELLNQEVFLNSYPAGEVNQDNFGIRLCDMQIPLLDGEVLVATTFISIDPYIRMRMACSGSHVGPWMVGSVCDGQTVSHVLESQYDGIQVGDHVKCFLPWRRKNKVEGRRLQKLNSYLPPEKYLSCVGGPGLSALLPIEKLARPSAGEVAFVSSAASAVGQVAVQVLLQAGCHVVGSVGSKEKTAFVEGLGAKAFNYHEEEPGEALARLCPHGLDIFFDNVGGLVLDAALLHANPFGRFVLCGAISQYDKVGDVFGVKNLQMVIFKKLSLNGFVVTQWESEWPAAQKRLIELFQTGGLISQETIVEGLSYLPAAFVSMFKGGNLGKLMVKL